MRQPSLFDAAADASGAGVDADPGAAPGATPGAAPDRAPGAAPGIAPAPAPGAAPETAVPVARVNAAACRVLEGSFRPMWVVGEVANWRRHTSGHCWFTLRDPDNDAQLPCVMWESATRSLPTDPEDGMEVCAFGQISLYARRGAYQLVVQGIEAKGEGLWRLAFERLRRTLAAEGILDPARKRPLPRVPRCVGVVTSRTGAALHDVVSVIRRRAPWTRILIADCRVQGDGASDGIVAALGRVVRDASCDVIVLTRGGGSVEDLWPFNQEAVARAIAACPVPIVSAVGHEVDVTIADLVADVRAPTPSAAAELVVPDGQALRAGLQALGAGLVRGLRRRERRGGERVAGADRHLRRGMRRRLEQLGHRVTVAAGRLEAFSPLDTMRRGYAVPLSADGRVLRRASMFEEGARFHLRVVDGRIEADVASVLPTDSGQTEP